MRSTAFGSWTRSTSNKKEFKRRRAWLKRSLVFCGLALILLAFGMVLVDSRLLGAGSIPPPKNESLRLTVPKMKRVNNIPVYNANWNDENKLDAGAIHLKGTGYPWQSQANVYIVGHRLGYARTGSFLVFYDLNRLKNGDRVLLTDTEGRKYVYKVFKEIVVKPSDVAVTKPVVRKNIVSLQACTLPNYSKRLIVQAELVKRIDKPAQASTG